MGKNYFDHEDKVRFTESLLANSTDWQWFVEVIERDFEKPGDIADYADYGNEFQKIGHAFQLLVTVFTQQPKTKLASQKRWLNDLIGCSRVRVGILEKCETESNFFATLSFIARVTYLLSITNDYPFLMANDLFVRTNMFEKYDLSELENAEGELRQAADALQIKGFEDDVTALFDNINHQEHPVDKEWINTFFEQFYGADFFQQYGVTEPELPYPWQEELLVHFTQLYISSEGNIIPAFAFGGTEQPPISTWSSQLLKKAADFFDDERAKYMFDVVSFLLFDERLSNDTIQLNTSLLADELNKQLKGFHRSRVCHTSSSLVIEKLQANKLWDSGQEREFKKQIGKVMAETDSIEALKYGKTLGISLSSEQEQLIKEIAYKNAHTIPAPDDEFGLARYLKDYDNAIFCHQDDLEELIKVFLTVIDDESTRDLPGLFHNMRLFLSFCLNNEHVDKRMVKRALIMLQEAWQTTYYSRYLPQMHVSTTEYSVPKEELAEFNEAFRKNPLGFPLLFFRFDKDTVLDHIERISESFSALFPNKMIISERFPHTPFINRDGGHHVDQWLFEFVDTLNKKYSYKFLNAFPTEDLIEPLYQQYELALQQGTVLVDAIELYQLLIGKVVDFDFIEIGNGQVKLAHVTQLFPLLEKKIRELGAWYNIVPFETGSSSSLKGKSPRAVLEELLEIVFKSTQSFEGAEDILLIHFAMFNDNFLNVRNECVHGTGFQKGQRLHLAFVLTMVCIWIIQWRLDALESGQFDESQDEE